MDFLFRDRFLFNDFIFFEFLFIFIRLNISKCDIFLFNRSLRSNAFYIKKLRAEHSWSIWNVFALVAICFRQLESGIRFRIIGCSFFDCIMVCSINFILFSHVFSILNESFICFIFFETSTSLVFNILNNCDHDVINC